MKKKIPFVKLKFGPPTIVCWSRSESFWIALLEISLMAILLWSADDCRWPKIQFKKPEKMFFVSREFSRFVNFAFLRHFVIVLIIFVVVLMIFVYFSYYFFVFDTFLIIHFFIKNQSLIFRKKLDHQKIIKKQKYWSK